MSEEVKFMIRFEEPGRDHKSKTDSPKKTSHKNFSPGGTEILPKTEILQKPELLDQTEILPDAEPKQNYVVGSGEMIDNKDN